MDRSGSHFIRGPGLFGVALALTLSSCGKSPTRPPGTGEAQIATIAPGNNAQNLPLRVALEWAAPDSASSSVRYDVYLGAGDANRLSRAGVFGNRFLTYPLEPSTEYFWRIVARDTGGVVFASGLQSFTTVPHTRQQIDGFPLEVGARWVSEGAFYFTNVRPESLAVQFADTTVTTVVTRIISDTAAFGFNRVYQFENSVESELSGCTDTAFMSLQDGALMSFDFGAPCLTYPAPMRTNESVEIQFEGNRIGSLREYTEFLLMGGESISESYPKSADVVKFFKLVEYPLRLGDQWTVRDANSRGGGWRIDKTVIDFQRVTVPAGEFDCAVVSWLYDFDNDGTWDKQPLEITDYIAESGLIKRVTKSFDLVLVTYENPLGAGLADMIEEFALDSVSLPGR